MISEKCSNFGLHHSNQACDTIFPHRIWCFTSFVFSVWRNSAIWLFWLFLVATFGGVIRMKLVTPFFHTEFDAEQFLFALWLNSTNWLFCNFWWLLFVAWFEWSLWYQFSIDYLTLYKFLQSKSKDSSSFYAPTFLLKNRVVWSKSYFNFLTSTYLLKN